MLSRSLVSLARIVRVQAVPSRIAIFQRLCSTKVPVPVQEDAVLPAQEGAGLKSFAMFQGASTQPVSSEQAKQLQAPLADSDIEIRPDGLLYLPEIRYRKVLNSVFGPGGWALIPVGPADVSDSGPIPVVSREYALYVGGRFISTARGEQDYHSKGTMSYATAVEAAKSNAMMRCCKDLGIASELWDPKTTTQLRDKLFERVFAAKYDGKVSPVWIRKGSGEAGLPAGYKLSNSKSSQTVAAQPPPATLDTVEITTAAPMTSTKKAASGAGGINQAAAAEKKTKGANPNKLPSSAGASAGSAVFDLDSKVPSKFKKIVGKTWKEVATDPAGVQYLQWLLKQETLAERSQVESALNYATQLGMVSS
eukprot:TRINITY_DN2515_c0_g2_i2.p1 TRINITY_DN2515_c0_g2~~TRINITY_DN2515_c0_g2_i2.p1  ORF type:complete len:365 (+),score=100.37 TRINITY_DN2515_c0_g2_i2:69-1163(+)